MGGDHIVMLGTGTPNAEPDRSGPSAAVVAGGRSYLIDCGPGTVRRAQKAWEKGSAPLRADRLNRLFLTHLHSDHTLGLPDLLFTPWVLGRRERLKVFGPPGTREMIKHITKAWEKDIRVRRDGLEGANGIGYLTDTVEITQGKVYGDGNVSVSAFHTKHGSWDHSLGYRFQVGDKVVCFSGDCSPTEDMIENYRGCDILVHEVYSETGFKGKSEGWKRYHSESHTSSGELGRIASEVDPDLLILNHQLTWGFGEEDVLDDIRDRFSGDVVYARDLDIFGI